MLVADETRAEEYLAARRAGVDAGAAATIVAVSDLARRVRRSDIQMISRASSATSAATSRSPTSWPRSTAPCSTSTRRDPTDPERDRFILCKGHCAGALYSTLAHCGFFPLAELQTFAAAAVRRSTGTRTGPRCPASRPTPGRWATASRWPSGTRSRARLQGSPRRPSWCSATASCRRAATGRRR